MSLGTLLRFRTAGGAKRGRAPRSGTLLGVRRGSQRLLLAVALSAVLLAATGAGASASSRDLTPFAGLGTWLDIYANKAAWREPGREVAAIRRAGPRTLYLQ